LHHALDRPRLLDLLAKNSERRLILILGRAAQGKSTLAASFAKISTIPTAWMNLGREDSDPVNLFYLMGQSLQHAFKELDLSRFLSFLSGTSGPMSEMAFFREWAHSLFDLVPGSVQITMDGLDRLSSDSPSFKLIQILIEEARPQVHLILLSREMPPLSLEFQHLKIRQEALVLTNEEMAFTLDETRDYLRKIQQIPLDPHQLKTVHSLTEGWIGGLVLLSEFINRSSESSRRKTIPPDLPDRFSGEVFQYFSKELLSSDRPEIQQFLIKSSILEPIEAGFAEDLLGTKNAGEILRGFARRNLLVQSIYDSKEGWLFRYHQLFRNFLNAKFESELGKEEKRSLFLKAASLCEQRGDLEGSLKYLLRAQAYPRAASIIERIGMDLLKMGRKADLVLWITSLPEEIVETSPWLLYYLAMARRFTDVKENISNLWKALGLFKEKGIVNGHILALAYLIENVIHIGHYHSIPVGSLIKEGQAILQSLKSDIYAYERAVLWLQIGLAQIRIEGNVRDGVLACETSYLLALQLKDLSLQANALIFAIFGLAYLGDFPPADEHYEKLERLIGQVVNPELRAIQLYAHVILSTNRGDFQKATEVLSFFKDYIEKYDFIFLYPRDLYYRCLVNVHLEQFTEAEELANDLLNMAISLERPFFKGLAYGVFAVSRYHQGRFEEARDPARRAVEVLSSEETKTEIHYYWHKQMLGLICLHLHEDEAAEKEIEETLVYFGKILGYLSLAGSHFAMALLRFGQGKKEEASNHLKIGFQIAEKRKYEQFIFLGPRDLLKACILALDLKVPEAMDYASHLLCTRLSHIAEVELKKLSNHPDPETRERVLEIQRTIHRSRVPQLRIETLGGFLVFRGDRLVEDKEWDRQLPKQLLMAIAAYGTQKISKDLLIDDLWPDADLRPGMRNLKMTLHRLRKSLEPGLNEEISSSYVHLQGNYIFLDQDLCQVDIDRFLFLIKKGAESEKAGDFRQALTAYAEASDLYRGDFLPEISGALWADRKRDELRQKHIDLLYNLARLYERQGSLKKAISCHKKAIQADPLIEESYQMMTLYSSARMQNEALKTYEACKQALKAGLKTRPDPTTTALYEKIREKLQP
jgi:ATP/maltotriose-dependent transcriptional regulator MalT/DNA-binding SARP family transcriptional activator